jgi:hypothetical protein
LRIRFLLEAADNFPGEGIRNIRDDYTDRLRPPRG